MEKLSDYRKKIMEQQIKLNNKDKVILDQRNIVLEKQLRIEDLESELHDLRKKFIEPHQEFLNKNIKCNEIDQRDKPFKKECGECRRSTSMTFKCDNEYCCNYAS